MAWKYKGLVDKSIKPPAASNNSLLPTLNFQISLDFNGSCLTTANGFTPQKVISLYIVLEIRSWQYYYDGFTLRNSLFPGVKVNKYTDPDKYSYSGYGISFDVRGVFLLPDGSFGKNVILFGADTSLPAPIDNKKGYLILCKGLTQGLDDPKLTAEAEYSISFTKQ